ncbi:DUF6292 family protein [Streptomyces chartreusis]|uniref:DUF6292 family protein n=1 Tax=Streptomyces chartreusis TaxID=1969 RepID=UPI0033F6C813
MPAEAKLMLLNPPGWSVDPGDLPHWPYVKAVDDALAERGIPPGSVRASYSGRDQGLTPYMWLTWDVSRTGGRGGIRLHWTERQGWYYALIGMSPQDVLLYAVLPTFRTFIPAPRDLADVAEHLVHTMRVPDVDHRTEWDSAGEVRAATRDFRRSVFGLASASCHEPGAGGVSQDSGVQLVIDTQIDTYDEAVAAVRTAFGLNFPSVPRDWPGGPPAASRPTS